MFKKTLTTALVVSSLAMGNAQAAEAGSSKQSVIGLGAGAVAGAIVGGPIGLGLGAMLGAILGDKLHTEDAMSEQASRHLAQQAALESQLADVRQQNGTLQAERQRLSREVAQLAELRSSRTLQGSLAMDVLFRTGSDQLEPGAAARLAELGEALQSFPNLQIRLEGHTDLRGSKDANLKLSAQRIEAVKQALAAVGVPAERIETLALGEAKARAGVADADGLALDRRVSIQLELQPEAPAEHALSLKL